MIRIWRFLPIVTGFLLFAGCDKAVSPPPTDYGAVERIVYSAHVQPIFNRSCLGSGCHSGTNPAEALALESWSSVMNGSEHGAMVVAYRPDRSHLIFHVNTDSMLAPMAEPRMPPVGPLDREEVVFLMRWIAEGARNDDGDVPFSTMPMGKVYVTNQAEDEIAVIDIATNLLARMIPVGSLSNLVSPPEAPHNVVVDPQKDFFYVNLIVGNEIWKYRVSDDGFEGKLALGDRRAPAQIAITPDGSKGYVSNFDLTGTHRGVQVFNAQTMDLLGEIRDQRMIATHGVQLTHDGNWLWTANELSDNLTIIRTDDDSIVAFVKVDPSVPDLPSGVAGFRPYQLVFSHDDAYAYVTCRMSNDVRIFATETRQLVGVVPVGVNPLILDITPDGRYVYVANRGVGGSPSTTVSVVRTSDRTELLKISDVGVEPHGVAVTPDGRFVYVSCENVNNPEPPHHPTIGLKTPGTVAVIETATNQVIKRIEVGAFAAGVAIAQ